MNVHIGVDPGKYGGIAAIQDGTIVVTPMPLVHNSQGRPEHDLQAIVALLRGYMPMTEIVQTAFVCVERTQPLPPNMGGTITQFERGVARGWAWMLSALELPYLLVTPRSWQKVMLEGTPEQLDTKARSILACQRLFPALDLRPTPKCKKPSDGLADAALIAEYGRRVSR